jgi:hypothetical protein
MTPELLRALQPHLTLWSTYGPGADSGDPVIQAAWGTVHAVNGELPIAENLGTARVVAVIATARGPNAAVTRRAVLRLDPANAGQICAILQWESGPWESGLDR